MMNDETGRARPSRDDRFAAGVLRLVAPKAEDAASSSGRSTRPARIARLVPDANAAAAAGSINGDLAHLIVGSDDPTALVEDALITLEGNAGEIVGVLFPNEHPQMDNQSL